MTGDWLPQAPPPAPAADPSGPPLAHASPAPDAPDAPKKGTTSYVLWSVLLWADLALLALNFIGVLVFGIILVAAPGSETADWVRAQLAADSDILWLVLGSLVTFAVIPVAWVMGTRRDPIEGTKRFLHLHDPVMGTLKGILLAVPLLVSVVVLSVLYVLATQGPDGLTDPDPQSNPAVDALLKDLTLPLAVLVALGAGIGEEIFFRGFLQRYLGVWGQAGLFGLAHSAGGYIPQIVFALGLGVAFGFLVKRGWSLWTLMTAHAVYDVVLLATALASG
jgi:membrane protease YdiL (CAAX protease family)